MMGNGSGIMPLNLPGGSTLQQRIKWALIGIVSQFDCNVYSAGCKLENISEQGDGVDSDLYDLLAPRFVSQTGTVWHLGRVNSNSRICS